MFLAITLWYVDGKLPKSPLFHHLPVGSHTTLGAKIRCGLITHHTLGVYQVSAKSEMGVHSTWHGITPMLHLQLWGHLFTCASTLEGTVIPSIDTRYCYT